MVRSYVAYKVYAQINIDVFVHRVGSTVISRPSDIHAGFGSGPVFHYHTGCTGSEDTLNECAATLYPYAGSSCSHLNDVTLSCLGNNDMLVVSVSFRGWENAWDLYPPKEPVFPHPSSPPHNKNGSQQSSK